MIHALNIANILDKVYASSEYDWPPVFPNLGVEDLVKN